MDDKLMLAVCGVGVLLSILWWFLTKELRRYSVDITRHKLFLIRDSLFDLAMDEKIPFDNDAYRTMRITINGMIRFTEDLSFLRIVVLILFANKQEKSGKITIIRSVELKSREKLTEEQKILLRTTMIKVHHVIRDHIVRTSLVLCAIRALFVLVRPFEKAHSVMRSKFRMTSTWKKIDDEALLLGA